MICGLEVREGTPTATAGYEGVSGASRAAGPGTAGADCGGSPAPEPVRKNAEELGGANAARPARHAGGAPTTRNGKRSGPGSHAILPKPGWSATSSKKPPRPLRRRRCPVRAHEDAASPLPAASGVSRAGGVPKRRLGLAASAAIEPRLGECAARSRAPSCPCAHPADVGPGAPPSGIACRRVPRREWAYQAATQETATPLQAGAPVHDHDEFDARLAGGGACLSPNVGRHAPERDLGHRSHVDPHGRRGGMWRGSTICIPVRGAGLRWRAG